MKIHKLIRHITLVLATCTLVAACKAPANQAVASAQHYATDVGMAILEQGGNAFDAAIAMHYALAVVHPCCGNIGGGGVMTAYLSDGRTTVVDFRETAPSQLTTQAIASDNPIHHVGVPGAVMGMQYIHDHYGSLAFATLINPAIDLATSGYQLQAGDLKIFQFAEPILKSAFAKGNPFYQENKAYNVGDTIVQPQLAKTLLTIRDNGPESFYQGSLTQSMLSTSRGLHGTLQPEDFDHYQVKEREPIQCQYHDYTIVTAPPPYSGITICQTLRLLASHTPNPTTENTPESMRYRIDALRQAYQDRAEYLADPDFVDIDTRQMISNSHIKEMYERIMQSTRHQPVHVKINEEEGMHTTAYVVADKAGNVVSMTTTVNSYFGSGIYLEDLGFFLNNEMDDFHTQNPDSVNQVEPNKRPLSAMSPTIVLHQNHPILALGSPGGATIPTQLINTIIKLLDQKLSPEKTLASPRFFPRWHEKKIHIEPGVFDQATQKLLNEQGETLISGMGFIKGIPSWGAVALLQKQGKYWHGFMDPRRPSGSARDSS